MLIRSRARPSSLITNDPGLADSDPLLPQERGRARQGPWLWPDGPPPAQKPLRCDSAFASCQSCQSCPRKRRRIAGNGWAEALSRSRARASGALPYYRRDIGMPLWACFLLLDNRHTLANFWGCFWGTGNHRSLLFLVLNTATKTIRLLCQRYLYEVSIFSCDLTVKCLLKLLLSFRCESGEIESIRN